jgi:pimeloyl-ACP methyl ester carboxylesterase
MKGSGRRVRRQAAAAGLALACAAAAAGCTDHSSAATPEPTPSQAASPVQQAVQPVSPDPASSPALAGFYSQQPAWTACDKTFQCAKVTVPLDWTAPAGPTIQLAMERLPASDPTRRLGSLLVNPGGPGASGVDFVRGATEIYSSALRAQYDIVGFDPRGIGSSDPVHCLSGPKLDAFLTLDSMPDTPAQIGALQSGDADFAAGCKSESGGLLLHVGTRDVVRDLDVMRAVLGDAKLNWFGFSYGTYIGSFYAGMFPQRVGRMVLDGPVDPSLDPASLSEMQAAGFQDEFDRFADFCLATGQCPIGSSRQQITDAVIAFVTRLIDQPQRTSAGRLLTESDAINGIAFAMYEPKLAWQQLVIALAYALQGKGDVLLTLADQILSRTGPGQFKDNSNEANLAVNCLDHPGDDTVAEAQAALPAMRAASAVFGVSFAWGNLACADMPELNPPPQPGPIRAVGAAPILVVGGTHDPATPYPWALALAQQLSSATLLTRDGDGHTSYGQGNTCIDSAVDGYLLSATMPKAGTRC